MLNHKNPANMAFKLPALPYGQSELAPVMSEKTISFHYGKHHQAYVNNLNSLIVDTGFKDASLEKIVMEAEGGIFNNAAQVWNHTFFFESLAPEGGGEPQGDLARAIERDFGSFGKFRDEFSKAGATLFGSGWVWLVKNSSGSLDIVQESNAGNPMLRDLAPILTLDVWEHAYYLDYQNRRPDYIGAFWDIINWQKVGSRY